MQLDLNELVIPPNRIRRNFNAKRLADLGKSIEDKGQMEPIVVRDDGKTLVAGERRTKAITILHNENKTIYHDGEILKKNHIGAVRISDLDAYQIREAELEENTHREDLTVQEHALAVAELHTLRKEKDPNWTKTKTAEEITGKLPNKHDITDVSSALLIAENMDDPFVAAARNKKEAMRAVRDRYKLEKRQKLAKEFDPAKSPHKLIKGDCYEVLKTMQNEFDCIIIDPPYGIDIDEKSFWDGQTHEYADDDATFQRVLNELPGLLLAVAKPQCHLFLFCDPRRFSELVAAYEIAGWTVWPRPVVWDKGNTGSYGNIEFGFRVTWDGILFANKGKKPMTAGYQDQFHVNQLTHLPHPAGKPPALYTEIIRRSCYPGSKVLDCFCGSGPIFPGASENSCIATGIENNDKYFLMSQATLAKMQ